MEWWGGIQKLHPWGLGRGERFKGTVGVLLSNPIYKRRAYLIHKSARVNALKRGFSMQQRQKRKLSEFIPFPHGYKSLWIRHAILKIGASWNYFDSPFKGQKYIFLKLFFVLKMFSFLLRNIVHQQFKVRGSSVESIGHLGKVLREKTTL